ncbi:amidase family protein, partial [Agrobacterium tumefaciens]|uniref:amidase family protein n=1 Tax=Agrobacterium tumefaciens TaxID=358 RepID=UPI003BA23DF1
CALMLEAVAGFDATDAGSLAAPYPGADYTSRLHIPLTGMRLGVPRGYFAADIHPSISAVIEQSIASFRQLGVEIVDVPDFPYDAINALAIMMIRAEATALYEQLMTKTGPASLGAFTRSRLQEGFSIPATLYLQASALRGPLLMRFAQTVLADVDVLLAPVFPLPTPRIDAFAAIDPHSQLLRGELTRLTRPINFLGLPSLALPGGMCTPDDGGSEMPVGFQLIARPYGEALLFQFGHA